MARWLFKEEPEEYSFADLLRDGRTSWSGVTNNLALQHLRRVRAGDKVFFYHTGKDKAVVGIMQVATDPQPEADNPKLVAVEVEPLKKLARPVTLAEIKADKAFADWELVRIPRLSVVAVTEAQWRRIKALSGK